jgi:hypothetical protein
LRKNKNLKYEDKNFFGCTCIVENKCICPVNQAQYYASLLTGQNPHKSFINAIKTNNWSEPRMIFHE